MTKDDLFKELLSLVVPGEITQDFELKEIIEKTTMITLYFKELPDRRPKELEGKEMVLDGFVNQIELQTFPLKDKTVPLAVRRRRRKAKGDKSKSYSNIYDLHLEGMKTTKEFGAFLKEELGLQSLNITSFVKALQVKGSTIYRWYRDVLSGYGINT